MKTRYRLAVLGVLLVAAAGSEVRAQIGPIEVVSFGSAFDATDVKQVSATCPPGTIAFSGGAEVAGPAAGGIVLHQSLPQGDPPSSWLALALERTPTAQNWGVVAFALCATVPGYELVDESTPFDSSTSKTITAECPPGKVPIGGGGGVFILLNPNLALTGFFPTPTGWSATGRELTAVAGSWVLNVKVSCAPGLDVEQIRAFTFNATETRDALTLLCPAGREAIAAGGAAGGNSIGALDECRPRVDSGGDLIGWDFAGERVSGSSAWSLDGQVLCYLPIVFADGFESGSTGGWSATVR